MGGDIDPGQGRPVDSIAAQVYAVIVLGSTINPKVPIASALPSNMLPSYWCGRGWASTGEKDEGIN